jgi:sensor c-di-GMP phosphodiesterase-like protein
MNKRSAILLTLVVATFSIAAPIWIAVEESRKQGYSDETDRVLLYAKDVIHRSDATADQVSRGIKKLKGITGNDVCSDASIALMREVDLASSQIQAFGYVAGDRLMCSSLGSNNVPLELGPADLTTSRGTVIRKNVKLPFAKDITFISLEQRGYAAIIHKDSPIDTSTIEADVILAIFSREHRNPLSVKGVVNPDWAKALNGGDEVSFTDGSHIIAVVKSTRYLTVAVAAMPISYLKARTNEVAKRLVPVGVIAGILLSLAIFQLARIQMALPAAIRAALKRDEFFLLYQPIVDLKTGQWVGAEALIRWQRTAGEIVSPDVFIPIAEENGLIKRITERVLQLAARDIGDGFQLHPDFHVAINLSAADLHSPTTPALLARFLSQTGAHPRNLIVEATERGFLQVDIALKITNAIRAQGIALAIDDFGTGYSSLSCLQLFKLDFLKIDKSFVETVGTDAPTSHVVAHIIEMAKDMGMDMIAEGVETEAQACYLREHGVRYAQGWLYGRPMPFNVIMAQLADALYQSRPAA